MRFAPVVMRRRGDTLRLETPQGEPIDTAGHVFEPHDQGEGLWYLECPCGVRLTRHANGCDFEGVRLGISGPVIERLPLPGCHPSNRLPTYGAGSFAAAAAARR